MPETVDNGKPGNGFDAWCVLDLFGHQRTAGHVTEQTIGGCSFIRIDVPEKDGGYRTEYYGNGAVYSMRPVTEELARAIALRAAAPVSAWDLSRLGLNPAPAEGTAAHVDHAGEDDEQDD